MTLDELIKKLLEMRRYYKQNTRYEDVWVFTQDEDGSFYCEVEGVVVWKDNQILIQHG